MRLIISTKWVICATLNRVLRLLIVVKEARRTVHHVCVSYGREEMALAKAINIDLVRLCSAIIILGGYGSASRA